MMKINVTNPLNMKGIDHNRAKRCVIVHFLCFETLLITEFIFYSKFGSQTSKSSGHIFNGHYVCFETLIIGSIYCSDILDMKFGSRTFIPLLETIE